MMRSIPSNPNPPSGPLARELERVSLRHRRTLLASAFALAFIILALMGVAVRSWLHGAAPAGTATSLIALSIALIALILIVCSHLQRLSDPLWIAHRIEQKFPDLDARLLAALEKSRDPDPGFLDQTVINQSLAHAQKQSWINIIPGKALRLAQAAQFAALLLFAAVLVWLGQEFRFPSPGTSSPKTSATAQPPRDFDIRIVPEDTSIERNTALLVTAEFGRTRLPADVQLLYREADGPIEQMTMTKSLDDPLFGTRIPFVKNDISYAIRYGDTQTRWFKASVFDYPALRQADAALKPPAYTGLPEKKIEDTRSITAIEGTKATLTFHLNKPVTQARLTPEIKQPTAAPATSPSTALAPPTVVELTPDPKDSTLYTASIDLTQSAAYNVQLIDADHRTNKDQAEFKVTVTPNKPADIKMVFPVRDVAVSPIEELNVKASVSDDIGVKKVGITYSLVGQPPTDVTIAENLTGKEKHDVSQIISLEKLAAQPDQLLSYNLWADDIGPDGKVRRTYSDMYFAEVRPFEEIYRQGQQPARGEQEARDQQNQQNPQGQQNAGQNAQRAENLAESEKQIIAATWKLIRRESPDPAVAPTAPFESDAGVISDAQTAAREQATSLGDTVTDARSQGFLKSVLLHMSDAIEKLDTAKGGPTVKPLPEALASEQAAYQDLLGMRAREFEVVRGNQQQGQQNRNSASARRQQQLDQLDLANQDNRYETQRNAQQQQQPQTQQQAQQRENRQVLSRLNELAQRQQDLNRQMRELQSALQQARDQQQRDQLERQLATLRDQQQQMLRDTDELRNRMDQPENQDRMADSRQALDQTREDVRRAADDLQNGQMQEATAAGQRASEQLNNIQQQVRRAAAGDFNDDMNRMRQDARALDQTQQQLNKQLSDMDQPAPQTQPGLRDSDPQQNAQQRQTLATDLQQQKQDLDKLLDNMKQTIEQAETPEPLLSRQLYDTLRQTRDSQTPQNLDTSRQLLKQGLVPQSRQTETEAAKGIAQLRQGIEQAAQSVLGDDTEALRRARAEVDNLSQQVNQEIAEGTATQPSTQPGQRGFASATQPSTQPGGAQLAQNQNTGLNTPNSQSGQRGGQANPQQNGRPTGDTQIADAQPRETLEPGVAQPRLGENQTGQPRQAQNQNTNQTTPGNQGNPSDQAGAQPRQTSQQANGEQSAEQTGQQPAQQPGQRGEQQRGQQATGQRGGQPSQQPGDQQASAQQDQGQQPADQRANAQNPNGQQPGQRGNGQRGGQSQNNQQANGQRGNQPGQRGGQAGQQPGDQQASAQQDQGQQPADQQANTQNPNGQQPSQRGNGQRGGQPQNNQQANGQRGNQPGQRGGQRGGQPGQQPGDQQASTQQRQGQQPADQQANAQNPNGQQPGQRGNGQRGGGERGGQPQNTQQANGQRGGGQQPGQRGGQQGGQPGDQQAQTPRDQQPDQQPNNQQANAQNQNGEQRGQRGNGQRGGGQRGGQPQNTQQATGQRGNQPGQRGQPGGRGGQPGNQPGQPQYGQPTDQQLAQNPNQQPNDQQATPRNGQRGTGPLASGGGGNPTTNPTTRPNAPTRPDATPLAQGPDARDPTTQPAAQREAGRFEVSGYNGPEVLKPITGEGFREWSDRMRDVEEMVGDPRLSAEAAAIRQRVAALRASVKQNGLPPDWQTVQQTVSTPLAELRGAINNELLKRESAQAQVPIDSEPVPPAYQDQVRRYYERLGSGK